jgi:hypothetical protein
MRGSCWALGPGARCGHGVPSLRATRPSPVIPCLGAVCGSQEILCLPTGQVTTWRSPSTRNGDVSTPVPVRAGQLGSSAPGPMRVTPYVRWLSTRPCESV